MTEREILVKTAGFTYRVVVEKDALMQVGEALRLLFPSTRALLVSDRKVYELYGKEVEQSLAKVNLKPFVSLIEPGEQSKNLNEASRLYDAAVEAGLDRNSPVIALGGGVVGDLAGFVAATYMRGVPLVMLPTTLLAQVDSSVGGKVAVNHPCGKNLIGTIYPPRLVLIDPQALKSLPGDQFLAGLAEVLKYGIIVDSEFFFWLEENIGELLKACDDVLADAVTGSVRAKANIVEADEYEKDYRRVLNFGHTTGHALEASTDYSHFLHGEAVLIGINVAVDLAERLSLLDSASADRIRKLLAQIRLKKPPAGLTAELVIDKLRQDKKRREDDLIFVLPKKIGEAAIIPVNDIWLLKEIIEPYLKLAPN